MFISVPISRCTVRPFPRFDEKQTNCVHGNNIADLQRPWFRSNVILGSVLPGLIYRIQVAVLHNARTLVFLGRSAQSARASKVFSEPHLFAVADAMRTARHYSVSPLHRSPANYCHWLRMAGQTNLVTLKGAIVPGIKASLKRNSPTYHTRKYTCHWGEATRLVLLKTGHSEIRLNWPMFVTYANAPICRVEKNNKHNCLAKE